MRMYFFINGGRVQNTGLRAKLMLAMNNKKLVGFADNAPTGTTVSVQGWGSKANLVNFYEVVKKIIPRQSLVTEPIFDGKKMPSSKQETRNIMYFNLEQMDKFIGVGKDLKEKIAAMGETISRSRKENKNGFNRVIAVIENK